MNAMLNWRLNKALNAACIKKKTNREIKIKVKILFKFNKKKSILNKFNLSIK